MSILFDDPQHDGLFQDVLARLNAQASQRLAMNWEQLPQSMRVEDNRNLPPAPDIEVLMGMMSRFNDPYKAQAPFPWLRLRNTPLARDAGVNDIPLRLFK